MIKSNILTKKAFKVINKRLRNERLTQQDSNYLSRFVRPKLREMASINAESLLRKLEYNQKAKAIERKIKNIILENLPEADSIIIYGSAVQTNYEKYNDIDVIVATMGVATMGVATMGVVIKSLKRKNEIIKKIKEKGRKDGFNLDIQVYSKASILLQYKNNPSLIYQLRDSKVIYGRLKLPLKIELYSLDLKMKLDWSEGLDIYSEAKNIYLAIRNAMLVLLLMNKKIDNYQLKQNLINILGFDMYLRLKNNQATKVEKKFALSYLSLLIKYLNEELRKTKWEKIEIENR